MVAHTTILLTVGWFYVGSQMPHKGGDRIHIRVKKMNQHVAANMNAVVTKVSKTANENVNILQKRWTAAMVGVEVFGVCITAFAESPEC